MASSPDLEDLRQQAELLTGFLGAIREFRVEKDHVVLFIGNSDGDFKVETSVSLDVGLITPSQDFRQELRGHVHSIGFELPAGWERAK